MASAIPIHAYHPPRHPRAAPTTPTPTSHATPRSSTSTGYYASSSTSTQHTSYWPNGPCSSVSTTSSASPRLNAGLAAAQFVTGRLHKRARAGQKTPEEIPDEMFDEGFFSGPGSPPPVDLFKPTIKSKNKIKPLLKKVSGSRNNSLDLSRSDGGLPGGVGLGIFDSPDYESSGVDEDVLETAFPKHPRKRHQRTVSGFSSASASSPLVTGANPTQPFAHPKRQVPRRGAYTPDLSRDGTSESSDDSEDEWETRRIVLSGSSRGAAHGLSINTNYDGHSTPRLTTTSMTDLNAHAHTQIPSSQRATPAPASPVSPVDSLNTISSLPAKKQRGRYLKESKTKKQRREPSPSFAASVTAARLAWEAKEEKKEEKREQKRRRSEAKEGERRISTSSYRGRGNSGSSAQTTGTVWNDPEPDFREKYRDEDEVYTGRSTPIAPAKAESTTSRERNAAGRKWGVLGSDPKGSGGQKNVGLKKRWLGFMVWVRIGMVRLGRKMGF
jgi:hypothetical protein